MAEVLDFCREIRPLDAALESLEHLATHPDCASENNTGSHFPRHGQTFGTAGVGPP